MSPIAQSDENCSNSDCTSNTLTSKHSIELFPENTISNTPHYTLDDISSWIGGKLHSNFEVNLLIVRMSDDLDRLIQMINCTKKSNFH